MQSQSINFRVGRLYDTASKEALSEVDQTRRD